MIKKYALILVALLVVPMLLTACSTESRDAAEDYMNALLKGEDEKALGLACESFQEGTQTLLDAYKAQGVISDSVDLKFDLGKGNNQKEIIVTGSFEYRDPALSSEIEAVEFELTEKLGTRIVLEMKEEGDDWCVSEKSEFGTGVTEGEAEEPVVEPTVEPTEEPTVEPTEKPTATVEPTVEPTEEPTVEPTEEPTEEPTVEPTEEPTVEPTEKPAAKATETPTK
ncbi:MAG: PT domain-containing protein [Chloroflexi bacterium]|nr:PT domain-containing protein [Chloroflexota bacterium]